MTGSLKFGFRISDFTTIARNYICAVFLCVFCSSSFAAVEQPKAVWYRYYDKNGVANVSTSVTPEHIRYGYEALDRNMQVIKKIVLIMPHKIFNNLHVESLSLGKESRIYDLNAPMAIQKLLPQNEIKF